MPRVTTLEFNIRRPTEGVFQDAKWKIRHDDDGDHWEHGHLLLVAVKKRHI